MLKRQSDIQRLIAKRFASSYAQTSAAEALGEQAHAGEAWPYTIALGRPSKRELVEHIGELSSYVADMEEFAREQKLELRYGTRIAGGKQKVPTHIIVPGIDEAASVAGDAARKQLKRARSRAALIASEFPSCDCSVIAHVVARCDTASELDFKLLAQAGLWFERNDAEGLTPRQVPLEGFHAKWLDGAGRRKLISLLSGKEDLGLVGRPAQIDFAYLDPGYLARGSRRYDSYVLGDSFELPYRPDAVIVVENKDTYLRFPSLEGGICVFGCGNEGAAHVCQVPWIHADGCLYYWGDMDANGLEILNDYRKNGLDVSSILMDINAYRRYERFGTSHATGSQRLEDHRARDVDYLTNNERELYDLLVSPRCPGPRRIEQERIPLAHALEALQF